jgi:hypothetical protein
MLAKVVSRAVIGLKGAVVPVELEINPGLPSFTVVVVADGNSHRPRHIGIHTCMRPAWS